MSTPAWSACRGRCVPTWIASARKPWRAQGDTVLMRRIACHFRHPCVRFYLRHAYYLPGTIEGVVDVRGHVVSPKFLTAAGAVQGNKSLGVNLGQHQGAAFAFTTAAQFQ